MEKKLIYKIPKLTNLGNLKLVTLKAGSSVDTDNQGVPIGTKPGMGGV